MKLFSFFKSQPKPADPFENADIPSPSLLPCLGAIIGDTIGSVYEFDNIKTTKFPLFQEISRPTDDSVMTVAVADWLANTNRTEELLIETLVKCGQKYPYAGQRKCYSKNLRETKIFCTFALGNRHPMWMLFLG